MNYLFIQPLTVRGSSRGYSGPVGLLVYDVPLFMWWACAHHQYYPRQLQSDEAYPAALQLSAAWAFPKGQLFRQSQHVNNGDGTFRIHGKFAGGQYKTVKLDIDELLKSNVYGRKVTCFFRAKVDASFETSGPRYVNSHEDKFIEWLLEQRQKTELNEFGPLPPTCWGSQVGNRLPVPSPPRKSPASRGSYRVEL